MMSYNGKKKSNCHYQPLKQQAIFFFIETTYKGSKASPQTWHRKQTHEMTFQSQRITLSHEKSNAPKGVSQHMLHSHLLCSSVCLPVSLNPIFLYLCFSIMLSIPIALVWIQIKHFWTFMICFWKVSWRIVRIKACIKTKRQHFLRSLTMPECHSHFASLTPEVHLD